MEGVIFDEFHYIPELTEILKTVSDEIRHEFRKEGKTAVPTRFVLTGSHNYLFDKEIRETMVGRAALIKLLPFTLQESGCTDPFKAMYKGGYPILYVNGQVPQSFFPAYIENYLEREVKTVHGIDDLRTFRKFMEICASLTWKKNYIQGEYLPPAYFWNVTGEEGYEVDMIMEGMTNLKAIEIKSGDTFDPKWFGNMQKHEMLREARKFAIYTGPTMDVEGGRALNFTDLDQLFLR